MKKNKKDLDRQKPIRQNRINDNAVRINVNA